MNDETVTLSLIVDCMPSHYRYLADPADVDPQ